MVIIKTGGNEKLEISSYFKIEESISGASFGNEQHLYVSCLCPLKNSS